MFGADVVVSTRSVTDAVRQSLTLQEASPPHVRVVPWPIQGHLHPILALLVLSDRRVHITCLLDSIFSSTIDSTELSDTSSALNHAVDERLFGMQAKVEHLWKVRASLLMQLDKLTSIRSLRLPDPPSSFELSEPGSTRRSSLSCVPCVPTPAPSCSHHTRLDRIEPHADSISRVLEPIGPTEAEMLTRTTLTRSRPHSLGLDHTHSISSVPQR
eukprot:1885595-Rhodomonas_salina.1